LTLRHTGSPRPINRVAGELLCGSRQKAQAVTSKERGLEKAPRVNHAGVDLKLASSSRPVSFLASAGAASR
jgi:hypothetical protein